MPIYEFRCLKCGELFEKFFKGFDEETEIKCPKCQSETFERVISRASHIMTSGKGGKKPTIASKSCSSGNECTTFEIPGPDD